MQIGSLKKSFLAKTIVDFDVLKSTCWTIAAVYCETACHVRNMNTAGQWEVRKEDLTNLHNYGVWQNLREHTGSIHVSQVSIFLPNKNLKDRAVMQVIRIYCSGYKSTSQTPITK